VAGVVITTPISPALVRGAAELERTERGVRVHRLPGWVRDQVPDPQLLMVEGQPSGVRLAFATAARAVELDVHSARVTLLGLERPRGHVDLVIDGDRVAGEPLAGGDLVELNPATGARRVERGTPHTVTFGPLPAGNKVVELWLPHTESVDLVELRTDAPISPAPPAGRRWVHHGSSISQGSNATTPSRIWPAVAALRGRVDLRNLGLGGGALVDPFIARVIRDAPADLISVKLGINVVNLDGMRRRTFEPAVHGFLDTIRDGHPDTPLVLISPVFCGIHEDTPGPGAVDPSSFGSGRLTFTATGRTGDTELGRLTLRVIREALAEVAERRAGDPHLHYLDGTTLYGEADAAEHPLPDALHPDTATHQLIGERFAGYAFGPGGPFAARLTT
jgi:hypothetical protein